MSDTAGCYGCMAVFATPEALLDAVRAVQASGCSDIEIYAPCALDGLDELLPVRSNAVAWSALLGGLVGGLGTLGLEYYAAVVSYPIRVGGRPFASWPAFVPPALEMTFLFAAAAAVLAMLIGNRLPQWYHPVFHVERFARVSQDAFALVLKASDRHDADSLAALLRRLQPVQVVEVPA